MFVLAEPLGALSAYRQFIVYRLVPSSTRPGKTDKLPIDPVTNTVVSAHDPKHWLSVDEAAAYAEMLGPAHGVGFVFTPNDPFWFLDIDSCDENGDWKQYAKDLASRFPGCAIEISSSGHGLHLFGCAGSYPTDHKTRYGEWFEFYTSGRFAALTSASCTGNIWTDHSAAVNQLITDYLTRDPNEGMADWTTGPVPQWRGSKDDDELISRMINSTGGMAAALGHKATFQQLWDADADALAKYWPETNPHKGRTYNASAADASLAQALAFWTGKDCERMERLMRRSALVRDKWDHHGTYLKLTIRNAVGRQTAVLEDKPVELAASIVLATDDGTPKPIRVAGSTYVSVDEQERIFTGCVYISTMNRALVPGGHLMKPESFRVMYGGAAFLMDDMNQKTTFDAWECFTQSRALRRPTAHDLCFRPELPPAAIVKQGGVELANSWWPIDTPCVAGDPTPFLTHMAKLFPDARDRELFLSYMAAIIQYPGVKFQWAPLIQGVEGNGKTFIITAIRRAIGDRYCHLPNIEDLASTGGKFTGWLRGKIFLGLEEVRIDDRRNLVEILKPIITNSSVEIQAKGQDQTMGDNRANIIACSNHKDAIPKSNKDRRWAIFYTAQQEETDLVRDGMGEDYMPKLWNWANADGFAIIHHYLKHFPIKDEMNPATLLHRAPQTTSTNEAIVLSAGAIEQEIQECIEQGLPGFCGGWISSLAFDKLLDRLNIARRIPPRKRRDILVGMGYDWHPALVEGRSTISVKPDGGRPRLFVKKGHILRSISDPHQACKKYESMQTDASIQLANFGS